jgi:hypothetical protein
MSRSGYCDDIDNWQMIKWRGQVASAIRGARGQACLREMLAALDAMPTKELIKGDLALDGQVCALGALGNARGVDMSNLDPEEPEEVAAAFNIAPQLAQEIVYVNDEGGFNVETNDHRWKRVRHWVFGQLMKGKTPVRRETEKAE